MAATYGRWYQYQTLVLLLLGGLYICTFPVVQLQPFVTPKINGTYPGFTDTTISGCQTMLFVGWAVGFLIVSPAVDSIGRKMVYVVTAVLVLATVGNVFAPSTGSLLLYGLTLFFMGIGNTASAFAYIFLCESLPGSWRAPVTVSINIFYSSGLGLCAYVSGSVTKDWDWRFETLVWFIPFPILGGLGTLLLYEPLYFLITRRRWESARKVAAGIARFNGIECPNVDWPQEETLTAMVDHPGLTSKPNPLRIISTGPMLLRTSASAMTWTAATLGYYGLSYSAGALSDSIYTNMELFALADVVGYLLPLVLIPLLGRRGTQTCAFIAAAVLLAACGAVPLGSFLLVACAVGGRLSLAICFVTVYILSVECFPTSCRSTAIGICNFIAGMLGLAAPLLGNLPVAISCPIFGTFCLLAAGATFCLPETGAGSLEEAEGELKHAVPGLLQDENP